MKETNVTAKLIKHINALPQCFARKRHGGAYTSGDPDIHICFRGVTIFIEMKLMAGELSDLQAVMMQRWQNAGAVCVLGVWDAEQKCFAFFTNCDWKKYVGKVKKHVDMINSGEYFNARYPQLEDALKGWYADSRKSF